MADVRLPAWLRRSIEAAILAGLVAIVSLLGGRLSTDQLVVLPQGPAGVLLLAPSVLALAVIPVAYPVGLAATRSDAVFGALAAFLIAADATVLLAGGRLSLEGTSVQLPAGVLAVLLAAAPGLVGMIGSQLAAPLGFGRHAGAWSAALAAIGSIAMLVGMAALIG